MTFQDFKNELNLNTFRLKDSTTQIANKCGITEELVKTYREQLREERMSQNKELVIRVNLEDLDTTPTEEMLERTGYKVDPRVPVAPKGFSVSSFKEGNAWFKKEDNNVEEVVDFSKVIPKPYKLSTYVEKERKCMQIIFPTDSHVNRLEISGRTIDEKCQEVIDKTIEAVELAKKLYSIDTIVFLTGSDMFNSTGKNPFTVKGTLQENSTQYNVTFEKVVDMNVTIINYLYQNCKNLSVYSVLGNHDEVECYMLGKYLQAYYRQFPIAFQVEKKFRKYIDFGVNGICINHGDIPKFENLIAAMASERPDIYCKKYTEVCVGDKHHQKVTQLGKTVVRQYPSLAKNDTWSDSCGFAGEGFISEIYDFDKGHLLTIDLKS